MTTAIVSLLAANLAFFLGWFGRDIYNKLIYVYYRIKETENVSYGSARPEPKAARPLGQVIATAQENETQVVRRMTPKMIKVKKQLDFNAKHHL